MGKVRQQTQQPNSKREKNFCTPISEREKFTGRKGEMVVSKPVVRKLDYSC